MPYANEHAARLRDPDDFVRIVQLWAKESEGIRALGGPLKSKPSGGTVEQAIRFKSSKWTVAEAKKWLSEHGYKPISFEPATGESQSAANEPQLELAGTTTWFEAKSANGEDKLPTFSLLAYTGTPIKQIWSDVSIIVDLAGIQIPLRRLPVNFAHDRHQGVGHTEAIYVKDGKLYADGVVSRATPTAAEVVASAKKGFPWQASIGAFITAREVVGDGEKVNVNGKDWKGPLVVARKTTLVEISFVDLGADIHTEAKIAAEAAKEVTMAEGEKGAADGALPSSKPEPLSKPEPPPKPESLPNPVVAIRAEATAEIERIAKIRKACAGAHAEIEAKAIKEGWDEMKAELEVLRADRPKPPAVSGGSSVVVEVLEAAVCQAAGLVGIEKRFSAPVLEAAGKRFRRGIGLQELLLEAAYTNGYSGRSFRGDMRAILEAAFSTLSLPGILSNVANKFLLAGFTSVEQVWKVIAGARNVKDFKQVSSYRLAFNGEFEEVAPGGELKHATAGELSYTNQAKTYGKMFAITRQDLINDDLGALTDIPKQIGRGAGLKINDVFWSVFMNNGAFFTGARANYFTGAGTVLQASSLATALRMFREQTDPNGKPLGVEPKVLLVPSSLEVTALELMTSTNFNTGGSATDRQVPSTNIWARRFTPVVSAYLVNSKYTGNSAVAWYLLADPNDMAVIEAAFLNGVQEPTVESADVDFNLLGIQVRGYFDFGVALQEYRGGVKSKGAA